ncbi:MAG TPA: methyltransferase domain-containing protein [Candidatus Acidoferrales bacterium]|nr:methyltransferase domain-containing protein [Candidatus Acidoferrales bacterium]
MTHGGSYVGATGHVSRLDLYDPLVRLTVRERRFKRRLLQQAGLRPGLRVLDAGCGTGTLALMAKRKAPGALVVAIDGDPAALALARRKISKAGIDIILHHGLVQRLPYPNASFDRVLSTLVLHHLSHSGKTAALAETARVLAPGGEFHVADFGRPANALMRAGFWLVRKADGVENTEDNLEGRLPELIAQAGFRQVRETASFATAFGTVRLYAASGAA